MRKAKPLNEYEITALDLLVNGLGKSLNNDIARRLLATVYKLRSATSYLEDIQVPTDRLVTKAEYEHLRPYEQGFIVYWQGAWPGSELRSLNNPYKTGTKDYELWQDGQLAAVLAAQDSEE